MNRRLISLAVASCFAGGVAFANPTAPTVVNGSAAILRSGNLLQITNSPNAIINWGSFSIGASEITRFIQQSQASAVLNRVVGQDPSSILGALHSNGRVFLINPNGILFGAGAQIDVAGLVASSLNLSNADFLAGRLNFTEVPGAGSLINQGNITTQSGGSVYLVAPDVTNSGIITSPKGEVVLAAGKSVELANPGTPNLRVEITAPDNQARNLGQIVADSGRIGIYAGLINHSGTIRADSAVAGENGQILLKATKDITLEAGSVTSASGPSGGQIEIQSGDTTLVVGTVEAKGIPSPLTGEGEGGGDVGKGGTIHVLGNLVGLIDDARIDASGQTGGGTVLIGGDYQGSNPDIQNAYRTYFGPNASVNANAITAGDGGKVIVWSDDATRAYGSISARGGGQFGNGGFVEVSGKNWLDFAAHVDTRAPNGTTGSLLLDPTNVFIALNQTNATTAGMSGTDTSVDLSGPPLFEPAGVSLLDSLLTTGTLTGALATSNVTVSTNNLLGIGVGHITVVDPVAWSSSNSLTLLAQNNVIVNAAIANAGTGNVSMYAGWDGASTSAPVVTGFQAVNLSAPVTTLGDVILVASGGITQSAAAAVTANNLLADGGGGTVSMNTATNMVNILAGRAGGDFLFQNGKALTIGSVAGVDGITTLASFNSTIDVHVTSGNLTINKNISATGSGSGQDATVTLTTDSGGISVNSGVSATGGTGADSGGVATVTLNATNGNIAVNTGGSINAAGGVGTSGSGGAANVTLTATNGGISLNASSSITATGGLGGGSSGGAASVALTTSGATGGAISMTSSSITATGGAATGNFGAPGSASVTMTVTAPDQGISISSSSITVNGGAGAAGSISSGSGSGGAGGAGAAASIMLTGGPVSSGTPDIALTSATLSATGGAGGLGGSSVAGSGGAGGNGGGATVTINSSSDIIVSSSAVSATGGTGGAGGDSLSFGVGGTGGAGGQGDVTVGAGNQISMSSAALGVTGGTGGAGGNDTSTGGASGTDAIGTLSLTATAGSILDTDGLSVLSAHGNGTHKIQLTAATGIGQTGSPIRIDGNVGPETPPTVTATNSTSGDIALAQTSQDVDLANYSVTGVSSGTVDITAETGGISSGAFGFSSSGPLILRVPTSTQAINLPAADGPSLSAPDITLLADNMNISGAVNGVSGGTVRLLPYATNRAINIEGSDSFTGLSLTPGEIQFVTTSGVLEIGRSTDTGTLTVAAPLTSTNVLAGTLKLAHENIAINQPIDLSVSSRNLTLAAGAGGAIALAGDLNVGSGVIDASTSTVNPSGTRTITSTNPGTGFSAGTLNVGASSTTLNANTSVDTLDLSGGQLDGAGTTTATTFNWTSGQIGAGAGALVTNGTSTLSGSGQKNVNNTWTNNGTVNWTGGDIALLAGSIQNAFGATFNAQTAKTIFAFGGTFSNAGDFNHSVAGLTTIEVPFTNTATGTVDATTSGGTLYIKGNGTDTGAYTVASGATLSFATTGVTRNLDSGASISGAGNVNSNFGVLNFNAGSSYSATGLFTQVSGTTNFNTGNAVSLGSLQMSGGTAQGADNLTVSGAFNYQTGTIGGTGTLLTNGATSMDCASIACTVNRVWNNAGTLTQASSSVGTINVGSTGAINNQLGATFTAPSGSGFVLQGGGSFSNAGTFNLSVGAAINVATVNTGALNLSTNGTTLQVGSFPSNAGTIDLAAGTTLSTNSSPLTNAATGIIRGAGTIDLGGAALTNNGTVQPGGAGAIGTLSITGDLTQGASGAIGVDLAGSAAGQYDVLAASGAASLGGTLNVSYLGGYVAGAGANHPVMTYASQTGTFTINDPQSQTATYGATSFTLSVLVANVLWDSGAGDFLWTSPLNWSTDALPVSTQDVTIGVLGSPVTLSSGTQSIKSLFSDANLIVSGGSLTMANPSTVNATLTVSGGTVNANGGLTTNGLDVSSGTLSGLSNLIVNNSFAHSGGTISGFSLLDITQSSGTLTFGAPLTVQALNARASAGDIAVASPITASGNVLLDAQGAGSNVTVSTNIDKTSGLDATLELRAGNTILFNSGADVTSTSNKLNVILNSDRDANGAGAISLGSGTVITSNGGDITVGGGANPLTTPAFNTAANDTAVYLNGATLSSGAGAISVRGQQSAALARQAIRFDGGTIQSSSGNITLHGTGGGTAAGSDNEGIALGTGGTNLISSVDGNITLTGFGGAGFGSDGVVIGSTSTVQTTGTGSVTINGTGGVSSTGQNHGVFITGGTVRTANAPLGITGMGGASTGSFNVGVSVATGATVESQGTGALSITGTGGDAASGDRDYGVEITGAGTLVKSANGAITITGTGGSGTNQTNTHGVNIDSSSEIRSTGTATIGITGTGGTTSGINSRGVVFDTSAKATSVNGNVTIDGSTTATSAGAMGVQFAVSSGVESAGSAAIGITSTVPAGGEGIVVNGGTSQFGGPLATGDVLFSTNQGINLGASGAANVQAAGNVTLNAGAGVSQSGGSILANGLKLTGSGAFDLNQAGNDVSTLAANLSGTTSLTYRDANALTVGTVLGTSGITVTGPVSLTTGGAITQSAPIVVGGTSSFNAGANAITLIDASNDFTGAVSLNNSGANDVAVTDANAIVLGTSSVGTGTLTVSANGAITQTGALTQAAGAGLANIIAGASDITLTNAGNDFTGVVSTDTTGNVTITDANSFIIAGGGGGGSSSASFTLNANGTVSQSSAFTNAPAVVVINAGSGPIVLDDPGNNFTGNVSIAANTTGAVSLVNTNAAGLNFAASTVGGALSLTSGGPVTQSGAVTVGGTTTINAGANPITLITGTNDFTGAVSATNSGANAIQLADINAIQLGTITTANNLTVNAVGITQTAAPITVGGTSSFNAGAGPITLTNASNDFTGAVSLNNSGANDVAVIDANAIVLGTSSVGTGTLTVIATGANTITQTGPIVQAPGAGVAGFQTGGGAITLTDAGNDFTGPVGVEANLSTVAITDANSFIIKGGGGGNSSASYTLNANGTVSQFAAFTGTVPAVVVINAGSGPIVLDDPGNNFTGNLSVAATTTGAVSLVNTNAAGLNFAASTVGGALSLTSGGPVTQSGAVTVGGTTMINAGANPITLTQANDFTGAVSLTTSGGNVSITNATGLTVGTLSTAGGAVSITATSGDIDIPGQINAGTGGVTLTASAGTVFGTGTSPDIVGGTLNIVAANSIDGAGGLHTSVPQINSLVATTGLINILSFSPAGVTFGNVQAGGNVTLTSLSPLSIVPQSGNTTVSAGGTMFLSGTDVSLGSASQTANLDIVAGSGMQIQAGNLAVAGGSSGHTSVQASSGSMAIAMTGNVTLAGGTTPSAYALIYGAPDVNMNVGGVIQMNTGGGGSGGFARIQAASPTSINVTFTDPNLTSFGYSVNGVDGTLSSGNTGFFVGDIFSGPFPGGTAAAPGAGFNVAYLGPGPGPASTAPAITEPVTTVFLSPQLVATQQVEQTTEPNQVTQDVEQAGIGGVDEDKPAALPICR